MKRNSGDSTGPPNHPLAQSRFGNRHPARVPPTRECARLARAHPGTTGTPGLSSVPIGLAARLGARVLPPRLLWRRGLGRGGPWKAEARNPRPRAIRASAFFRPSTFGFDPRDYKQDAPKEAFRTQPFSVPFGLADHLGGGVRLRPVGWAAFDLILRHGRAGI
jgi:hypothetical protein